MRWAANRKLSANGFHGDDGSQRMQAVFSVAAL